MAIAFDNIRRQGPAVNAWFSPWRFGVFLLAAVLAAYPEVVLGLQTFFYRDFSLFGFPLAAYHRASFWQAEIPLWNPYSNCGLPHLAQWNTLTLYPLAVIYLLLPLPWGVAYFSLFHLLLAGVGMYCLALRWTDSRFAATVAGLGYALNGVTLHALMWPNNIAALAWLPWVVLFAEHAWNAGGLAVLKAGGVAALQILAGAPEVILFTWLLTGTAFACDWILNRRALHPVPMRQSAGRALLTALVAAGLTAAQTLPVLDLLSQSHRDATFANNAWAMPAWGWANLVVPLFHCTPSILGVYSQDAQQWTSSYYLGIAVIALAIWTFWQVRHPRVRFLAAVAFVALVLALGDQGFLYPTLRKLVPGLGFVRFPVKFVIPAVFALPLLAALGLAAIEEGIAQPHDQPRQALMRGVAVCMGLLGSIALVVALARVDPCPGERWQMTAFSGLSRAALLAAAAIAVIRLGSGPAHASVLAPRLAIVLVMTLDALTHTPRQNPTVTPDAFRASASLDFPRPKLGEARTLVSPKMSAFLDNASAPNAREHCAGQRRALFPNWNLLDRVSGVGGFYSLYPREQREVWSLIYRTTNFPAGLSDFLGARHMSSDTDLFAWVERPTARPLVSAGQKPVFAGKDETLRALAAADFDPAQTVFLPEAALRQITATGKVNAAVSALHFGAHVVEFDVQTDNAALVTVAQTYFRWWHASVNGRPVPLWRANHAFQALEVPAGQSRVRLVYSDTGFKLGAGISGLTLVICIVAYVWLRRRECQGRVGGLVRLRL